MNDCLTQLTCQRNGRVIHRICNNANSPHYKTIVSRSTCRVCKLKGNTPPQTGSDIPPKQPSLAKRIVTYTQAVAEWIAAGKPERSDEEVQRIFKEHCEKCSWRKKRNNICRGCGCRVAAYGMAVTNKIKMATQHCPREKW